MTGHHLNDQAETFLLALKRGAGLKGLSAMSTDSTLAQHRLVRPLLSVSRSDIVSYAEQQALQWIEDESNSDEHYDRNFLRHQVLPTLDGRWPSINKTIARSAQHCFEAQQLLDELAEQDLADCQLSENTLSVEKLTSSSQPRLKNLLRYFLASHHCLMPTGQQLAQICQQLTAEVDKSPVIQLASCCFRRFKQAMYITPIYQDISQWQHSADVVEVTVEKPVNIAAARSFGRCNYISVTEIIILKMLGRQVY